MINGKKIGKICLISKRLTLTSRRRKRIKSLWNGEKEGVKICDN